jgi:hypothetical protein
LVQVKNNDVITTATAGWTKIDQRNRGAGLTVALFIGTAAAASPVFTWASAAACGAVQWAYGCGFGIPETATWGATSFATGLTNPNTSPSITTTRDRSLVVYAGANNVNFNFTAPPAGWTENWDLASGTDAAGAVSGSRSLETAGSASGAISINGSNNPWVQFQVEILTTASPAGLTMAEEEVTAWTAPGGGITAAEQEIVGWIGEPGVTIAEEEIVLWLGEPPPPVVTGRRRQTYNN